MRIALVHDFARNEYPGGANLTLSRLVDFAPKNIEVNWLTWRSDLQLNYYDKIIIANQRNIPPIALEHLIEGKKFVKIHFDYGYVSPKITKSAQLLVFMSPKQRDDMIGRFTGCNTHVMPSLVDPELFYPAKERGQGYLWLSGFSRQKGPRALWEWAEENRIPVDVYGYGTPKIYLEQSQYCHIKRFVPYENIPELLRQYHTLLHLPKSPEAGSRIFIEALLSGLNVITTSFEGDLSFDSPYDAQKWRERLKKAPYEFWERVLLTLK